MANSILKLKVESEEYDAKLKKAAEGIRHLADVAHKGGGELTGLEKAELDYIKALGDMETKSRTAAGSTRELENAFKELTVIYNNLSDVEKADEGGKALAASLEKLKQRTIDSKSQLDAATKSLQSNESAGQSNSSALEQLASKFTINIDALKLFNIGLQALDAALGVAKDAFFSSETNVDEWGRTVESAKGIYEGFLQSINTGDISGFLNNINQITAAAREAYNALDELGTRQTILNPERAKLQARSTELKATIRREGADSAAGKAAAAELKALEKPLTEAWKTESKLNRDAFTALVKERLAEGGINLNQKSFNAFMKTFSSDAAFQNLRRNARGSVTTEMTGNAYNPNAAMTRRTVDTRNTEQKLLDLFTDEWRQANSGYLTAAYNAQGSAASTMLGDARYLKGGKGGSGSGNGSPKQEIQYADDSIMAQEKLVQKLTQDWKTASAAVKDDYKKQLDEAQATLNKMLGKEEKPTTLVKGFSGVTANAMSAWAGAQKKSLGDTEVGSNEYTDISANIVDTETLSNLLQKATEEGLANVAENINAEGLWESILNGENIPDEVWESLVEEMNEALSELGVDPIKLDVDTGKVIKDVKKVEKEVKGISTAANTVASVVGSIGQAFNSIEDPAAKVAGTVAQAIATLAAGYATATTQASSMGPWAWIAFAATGLATLISTVSSIHNITGYAQGGIVQGNTFSGDQVGPVMLDAGEVVLNRSQVGNLAAQLEDSRNNAVSNSHPYVSGEMIYLGVNNYLKRSGRGEIITSRG